MICKFVTFVILACLTLFFSCSSFAIAAIPPDPTEQLRPFMERIVTILTDPELKGEENCILRRDKVMEVASERFDFDEMSKRVLGKKWRKLDDYDRKYFVFLFTKLLEHAYIGKIETYSKQKVIFKNQRIKNDRAQVSTEVVDKDVIISVSFIMMLKGDLWKVYDIVVEGVSLVRNYMEQFKEILRKDDYATFLKQVEEKVTELEEGIGKPCPVFINERKDA